MPKREASDRPHFTRVVFHRYKALREFSISMQEFNVLVGPNNSGKSTIIGAFRILYEGIRRARARQPDPIDIRGQMAWGYRIPLEDLPIAGENVFFNYEDDTPAEVRFYLSNGNALRLHFPEQGACYLICESQTRVRSPTEFKRNFDVDIGFVPILGPVEHNEPLYQKEAARRALLSPHASRNFRNIWYHFPESFREFRDRIIETWPGMDIEPPEPQMGPKGAYLRMFCPEERFPREIYWAGYGFQVWAQMLTYIVQAHNASLLVIDEPDIYLHSDLQRQLVSLLHQLGPDILIATHSTEIISEVEPQSLLSINKKQQSARQIKDTSQVRRVFAALGSNLNPILTQLAKTRRALFVEGGDFQILAGFAKTLRRWKVANRADFAVVPTDGFNPRRAVDLAQGMEHTLDAKIAKAVVLDRDYRSREEVQEILRGLAKDMEFAWIHERKELENYILEPKVIERAVGVRLTERSKRTGEEKRGVPNVLGLLGEITNEMKPEVAGQYLARRADFLRRTNPRLDPATCNAEVMRRFEEEWAKMESRLRVVPGKQVLGMLNKRLQVLVGISVTATQICSQFKAEEIPRDIVRLLTEIREFAETSPGR